MSGPAFTVVVPTVGRPGLERLLRAVSADPGHAPARVLAVDDRPGPARPLGVEDVPGVAVLRSGGRGPATARDVGRLAARTEWVVFLDDDVEVPPDWPRLLAADLASAEPWTAGVQGRLRVPRPEGGRRPTDAERAVLGLEGARWITADMAYRRSVLAEAGGFDRRFPRAYREDTDVALRILGAGYGIGWGERTAVHPLRGRGGVRDSVRAQAGNADDALMRRLHGPYWRSAAMEPPALVGTHAAVTALLAGAVAASASPGARGTTAAALWGAWLGATARFAWRRIAPGPRTPREVAAMALSSAAVPPAACLHRLRGELRHRRARPLPTGPRVRAVLFDRDGTLVHDVPDLAEPRAVRPVRSARPALRLLRGAGLLTGVVTNQPGVARGSVAPDRLEAVHARVDALLGPFDVWQACTHAEDAGCPCRKPRPGLVRAAAEALGLSPAQCAVVGDTRADLEAALAAGALPVLVPNGRTRRAEVSAAPAVARDLTEAARLVLEGGRP